MLSVFGTIIGDAKDYRRSRTFFRKVTTCTCQLNALLIHRY